MVNFFRVAWHSAIVRIVMFLYCIFENIVDKFTYGLRENKQLHVCEERKTDKTFSLN